MAGTNYIITEPKGADVSIQTIQTYLFNKLPWEDVNVYGRVYKLQTEKGLMPRAFVSGNEYKDVFTDDRKAGSIFFILDDQHTTKEGMLFVAKTKVVFMVNLKKLFPDATKRADTEAQVQAVELINRMRSFSFNGEIETQVSEIFKGFNTDSIPLVDLQPYHVFSLNGEISYTMAGQSCSN